MTITAPSVTEVAKGQIYLGNLSAALSAEQRAELRITHILSVCPDFPSTGPKHLNISVEDTEYEDLLIHLPGACRFIEHALQQGGRVLVHCVMGISRSATVVAAFLMKTREMTAPNAIRYVKQRRPQVHPNYGFIKQLDIFAKCDFDPSPSNAKYRSWKRRHAQDVTYYLNHMADTVSIIPDKLLLSSEFPEDPEQAHSLLLDLGVTHLLSLSPTEISSAATSVTNHHHININNQSPEALLLALPDICSFIRRALDNDGLVLVHSLIESRACTAACAYLMASKRCSPSRAFSVIEDALPLFNPTRNFSRNLELFEACEYAPTSNHPVVKEWLTSQISSSSVWKTADLNRTAKSILSETGFDLGSFGDALNALQSNRQSYVSVRY